MGKAAVSEADVRALLEMLKKEWPVYSYNTLNKNCCHFSNEFCQRLGVGSIPNWVMNLAGTGAALMNAGDTACCKVLAGQGSMFCCGPTDDKEQRNSDRADTADVIEALPVLAPFGQSHTWSDVSEAADSWQKFSARSTSRSG